MRSTTWMLLLVIKAASCLSIRWETLGDTDAQKISGHVYLDEKDGPPLKGVTIELYDEDGDLITTTTTGIDGSFEFTDLIPAKYTVIEMTPPGYEDVEDSDGDGNGRNTISVDVTLGDDNDLYFVDKESDPSLSSISGTVKEDTDNNDSGDKNLSGVTVALHDGSGIVATTTTDSNGAFSFKGLQAGTY